MKRALLAMLVVASVIIGSSGTAGAVNRTKHRRPGPIRVLLVGDSLTDFYSDRVQPLLGPAYQVIDGSAPGSSLLDLNVCNGSLARGLIAAHDPDVIVVEYTGNYGLLFAFNGTPRCLDTAYRSAKWFKRWEKSAKLNQRLYRKRGARVVWMQVPSSSTNNAAGNYAAAIPVLNQIYAKVAGVKAETLDAWTPFGGSTFNAELHHPDGLHLSDTGNDVLASLVATKIRGEPRLAARERSSPDRNRG